MKSSFRTLAVALALVPAAAFAQTSNEPLTHAQVMNQLTQLRADGYKPSKIHYPADIQAAEARMAPQSSTTLSSTSGYGGATSGTIQSGGGITPNGTQWRSMFSHH